MGEIQYHIVSPNDNDTIRLIADWYLSEWKIPIDKTVQKLNSITAENSQLQVLMTVDRLPVSTGGLYNHVGLIDKMPRFKVYRNWLALVYTTPVQRQKGYGALICNYIQEHAKRIDIDKLYLFTDTAERLYKRLGWTELERLLMGARNIVVMERELQNEKLEKEHLLPID